MPYMHSSVNLKDSFVPFDIEEIKNQLTSTRDEFQGIQNVDRLQASRCPSVNACSCCFFDDKVKGQLDPIEVLVNV